MKKVCLCLVLVCVVFASMAIADELTDTLKGFTDEEFDYLYKCVMDENAARGHVADDKSMPASIADPLAMDLKGMTFSELTGLKQKITAAQFASNEWQEVTVPQGMYQIGVDIPVGYWKISAAPKQNMRVFIGNEPDKNKTGFKGSYDFYRLKAEDYKSRKDNDISYVTWDLTAGWIMIDEGSAVFTPFTGHDLGFK